jgi:hypothetical protein
VHTAWKSVGQRFGVDPVPPSVLVPLELHAMNTTGRSAKTETMARNRTGEGYDCRRDGDKGRRRRPASAAEARGEARDRAVG